MYFFEIEIQEAEELNMKDLNMKLTTRILSTPSLPEMEGLVLNEIREYSLGQGWRVLTDDYGNMYVQKGELSEGEHFPVLVAHVDTVHYEQEDLIRTGDRLDIRNEAGILRAYCPGTGKQTGIGGDDKAGVVVALEILSRIDEGLCAFFRAEEIGCVGSINLDETIMRHGGYAIQFDAPGNEVSVYVDGVKLFDESFLDLVSPTLDQFGINDFVQHNPFTDIARVRERLDYNTLNVGAGYHQAHLPTEYVVVREMEKTIACITELIQTLGNQHYPIDQTEMSNRAEEEWLKDEYPWLDEVRTQPRQNRPLGTA